jgi:diguanylate cyclase (GGDEF)-like protein
MGHAAFPDACRPPDQDAEDTAQMLRLELPVAPLVLIVDDDELVLARLQELVVAAGYPVRTAANGIKALECLERSPVSIVVTDLNMPGMGGLDLCRRIRAQAWPGYVYVVLLTVRDEENDILAGLEAGADDYVSKRTPAAQFTARLRTAKRILGLEYSLQIALQRKRKIAMTDALTGTYNRRYFSRRFGRELKHAQRFGGDVSLLVIDVDKFKLINDTFGHGVGDAVLRALSCQIGKCLQRGTDWCARLGGEEFAIVLAGTKIADAHVCAERMRRVIEITPIDTPTASVRITVSIGISSLGEMAARNAATQNSLLEQADVHLYASKASGRNRVTSSTSMHPRQASCQLARHSPK